MIATLLLLSAAVAASSPAPFPAPSPDQDPEIVRAARSAARAYESLLRTRAPYGPSDPGTGRCDEIIGRFCFRFGDDDDPPPDPEPEAPAVVAARRRAIAAHRRWLSADPGAGEAAGPLVRYLIEDDRAAEAVSLARAHVSAARNTESLLFLGLALHESGDVPAAEAAFDRARAEASAAERTALDAVDVLLTPEERGWYTRLPVDARAAYHARFWAFADPFRSRPGNERRSAHYARHAWIRILDGAPRAPGEVSWGEDRAEILLRYGLPRRRERTRPPPFRLTVETEIVSYYDPRAVPLVLPELHTLGVPSMPEPWERPPLERDTVRSAYAPMGVRRLRAITGQLSRLPDRDGWTVRIDAVLPGDTAAPRTPLSPRAWLVVLDTAGREVVRTAARTSALGDSTAIRVATRLPSGRYVYQLELTDDSTGLAGRARHSLELPAGPLRLSDPVLAVPGREGSTRSGLRPFPTLVFEPGREVLVYAEVAGLGRRGGAARYIVEWRLESRREAPALVRAVRWLGQVLGLAAPRPPVRVRWEGAWDGADPVPIPFVLDLAGAESGPYRLHLTVRDAVSGREVASYRAVQLLEVGAAEPASGRGRS